MKAGICRLTARDNKLAGPFMLKKALEELGHPCEVKAGEFGR